MEKIKLRRLKESTNCAWCLLFISLYRQALYVIVSIGEFKFGLTPRDGTIGQVNERDFIVSL